MNTQRPAENIVLPFMTAKTTPVGQTPKRPLYGFKWLPHEPRHHFIAMLGEFVGTFLFLFFSFAAVQTAKFSGVNDTSPTSVSLYICLAFAFSLAVNVWVFFRISGGLFNPAVSINLLLSISFPQTYQDEQVSLGLALIGAVGWFRALLTIFSQLAGATAAAAVVSCLFPGSIDNVRTKLSDRTSLVRGIFIEMFLTFELVFTIFMLAAEKHKGTFLAPIGIGLALFIAALAGKPHIPAAFP
jgi:aquaporin rerated protein, other eukaryote